MAQTDAAADPIPASVRDVLALFGAELGDQRFGDLDADGLEELAERVRTCAREVERARASLEAAQSALGATRDELVRRSEQALAYARIYAAGDESLSERLSGLQRTESVAPKRARRPRKESTKTAAEELPFEARGAA